MKERLISMCMIIVLTVSSSLVTFAKEGTNSPGTQALNLKANNSINDNAIEKKVKNVIDKDKLLFDKIGLLMLSDELVANIDENNNIIYEGNFGGYTNTISVLQNDENTVKMVISQDDIVNELIINNDGTYILDGNIIKTQQVTPNDNNAELSGVSSSVKPQSVEVINRITNICPYGSASDYTYKLGTRKNSNINLEKSISKIAVAAFGAILCAELGVTTIISKVYTSIYSFFKNSDPNIKGLSYKATNYAHKKYTNTYIKPIKMYGFKSIYKWYGGINYDGTTTTKTVYQTKEFS